MNNLSRQIINQKEAGTIKRKGEVRLCSTFLERIILMRFLDKRKRE